MKLACVGSPYIYGAYDYDSQVVANALPSSEVNGDLSVKVAQWKTQLEPRLHKTVDLLVEKLQYIDFNTFKQKLLSSAKAVMSDFSRSVVLLEPGKSQKWVTEIVREAFHEDAAYYVRLGETSANSLSSALDALPEDADLSPLKKIIIMDDGSFSGTQMENNVKGVLKVMKEKYGLEPKIHVVVPYITNIALEKLRAIDGDVSIHFSEIMSTVSEIADEVVRDHHHQKILTDISEVLYGAQAPGESPPSRRCLKTLALTWFQHKVPNSMSFPERIAQALLPEIPPPYKR